MMNRYDIKVFDKDGEYQSTINPNLIMNDISFSENTNGGQGQMNLNLALDFGDTTFHGGEIIKVILYNERYKQGKQIYFGYVSQISRIYDINKGYINIVCLGIASLLTKILYSGNYSGTAETLLNGIITQFNNNYAGNLITVGQIDTYGESLNFSFERNTTCFQAISNIADSCNYYRFVNSEGVFSFREKGTQTNHIVANKQALESMKLNYNIESMVNKLYVERNGGTVKTYQDTDSQNTYGIKEMFQQQTDLNNEATQDEYGNNYIAQYSNPKNASTIVINSEYDIESIIPGDTITVVNTTYPVKNLLIEKISYRPDRITLTLEENETLRSVISK